MTKQELRDLVIMTSVTATVSAVASSLVALAISRAEARLAEQRAAAQQQELSLRDYYLQEALNRLR